MTAELNMDHLCNVIESALKVTGNVDELSAKVTESSVMGEPREWDSLSFVGVFTAVSERFDIDVEYDDAIHFRGVQTIYSFLDEVLNE